MVLYSPGNENLYFSLTDKTHLGKAITEAMEKWTYEMRQKEIAKRELKVLEEGFDMGKPLFKRREELYER